MKYYVVTDTHFGHKKMAEYCGRPDRFEDLILEAWLDTVSPEDVVIHLGDVCFGKDSYWHELISAMPGIKWLTMGNHDNKSPTWYLSNGWDCVCEHILLNIYGKKVLFSHVPLRTLSDSQYNIFGHMHEKADEIMRSMKMDMTKYFCISMEKENYRPVDLESFLAKK